MLGRRLWGLALPLPQRWQTTQSKPLNPPNPEIAEVTTKIILHLHDSDIKVTTRPQIGNQVTLASSEVVKRESKVREFHVHKGVKLEFEELS